jgi:hypothetical protein
MKDRALWNRLDTDLLLIESYFESGTSMKGMAATAREARDIARELKGRGTQLQLTDLDPSLRKGSVSRLSPRSGVKHS